jgi:hypothetical protein
VVTDLAKCIDCYNSKTNVSTSPLVNALHECNGNNGTSSFSGSSGSSGSSSATSSSTSGASSTGTAHSGSDHVAVSFAILGSAMALAAAFVGN